MKLNPLPKIKRGTFVADVLEMKGGCQIPVFLLLKGPSNITQLREGIKATINSIYDRLEGLEEYGMIRREKIHDWPYPVIVSLTSKGEFIAHELKKMDDLLSK